MLTLAGPLFVAAASIAGNTLVASGRLVGCVSDVNAQATPGVTVIAKRDGVAWTTVADRAGCFELTGLDAGLYRVTARLLGFDNTTRDRVIISPDTATRIDFSLRVSPVCECVSVPMPATLRDAWLWADVVVYLRVLGPAPEGRTSDGPFRYYVHRATILQVLKRSPVGWPDPTTTLDVLEYQGNAAPAPYDPGRELLIFSKSADPRALLIGGCCGHVELAFAIDQDRIDAAPPQFSDYVGMPIETLLDRLRSVMR